MKEKDIAEKILESHNDVFSDIVNVLLFQGEAVVKEQELEEMQLRSAYKTEGEIPGTGTGYGKTMEEGKYPDRLYRNGKSDNE